MELDTPEMLNQRTIEALQVRIAALEEVLRHPQLARRRFHSTWLFRGIAVAGLAALLIGSQAFAAAPAPSNEIHGCYAVGKNGLPTGNSIRIIKVNVQHCAKGEATLAWNVTGPVGPMGPQGPAGHNGTSGTAGVAGAQGVAGPIGPQGSVGPTGPAGALGPQGVAGLPGAMGPMGPQGFAGPQGPAGPIGAPGAPGASGAPGATGPAGPQDSGISCPGCQNEFNLSIPFSFLVNANLSNADISGMDMTGSNLTGANLSGANMNSTLLVHANLTAADLAGADVPASDWTNANLTNANLLGMTNSPITTGVTWNNTTCPDGTNTGANGTCVGHFL